MTVAYDGTAFRGWQVQPGIRTVQGVVDAALTLALGEPIRVQGAGRTDAGVHARGQVASFRSATTLPARAIAPLATRNLPDDVRLSDAEEMPAGFHARHSAGSRSYAYRLLDAPDLLAERYAWWPEQGLDGPRLTAAAAVLPGVHDCSAFETQSSQPGRPECHITHAAWRRETGGWTFEVTADHFLYHMVRNLVGTMLAAIRTADPAAHVRAVIASRDRARCGPTAPAHGLCLESVTYDDGRIA